MLEQGEELIGARAWRVLFGVVSLPLAVTAVAYFINHRYDGVQLWNIKVLVRLRMHTSSGRQTFNSKMLLYGLHIAAFMRAEQGSPLPLSAASGAPFLYSQCTLGLQITVFSGRRRFFVPNADSRMLPVSPLPTCFNFNVS